MPKRTTHALALDILHSELISAISAISAIRHSKLTQLT